jgi:hypothetical protein
MDGENEWSYPMAKDLFYAALSGDSTKHSMWSMADQHMWGPPFYGKQNMNKEEREQFFAWTFQALGHTLHLLADATVPAHTRNDSHGIKDDEPYEKWTRDNIDSNNIWEKTGSAVPWTDWKNHTDIITPNVFIDTEQLGSFSTTPLTGSDQGLAEYSHANFMSQNSMFDYELPEKPGNIKDDNLCR